MLATLLMLRSPELSIELAHDGERAVALALKERYDFAVIDLNLPDLDGTEVALQIRRRWGSPPPVLTALSGSVAEIAFHQSSGMFEHALIKPVNIGRLLDILGSTE